LKLYKHEASHGLFATAELLVQWGRGGGIEAPKTVRCGDGVSPF